MLAMAKRLVSHGHEVVCLLSEAFQDGIDDLRQDILKAVPGVRLSSFQIPSPCAAGYPENAWRQMAARILREHAIACLEPDFVHVPALLADGWGDDAVGSVGVLGVHVPTSLTQHDLIPLVMADPYMPPGPFRDYYLKKLEGVKQADLLLAISEYSRREAIEWLGMPASRVIHISSAADEMFAQSVGQMNDLAQTLRKLKLHPGFLLYAPGGFDPRKNIDRLLEAYSLLPSWARSHHQLAIASKLEEGMRADIERGAAKFGIAASELVLTDYVSDDELKCLYKACYAYVFPSLHEGFGLPVLEAMMCGAPVIAANCTSIPEVVGMEEALFDPYSLRSMADMLLKVIDDQNFRERLKAHAAVQPHRFSWEDSANIAVAAIEQKYSELKDEPGWGMTPAASLPTCEEMLAKLTNLVPEVQPADEDLAVFQACYSANREVCRA